MSLILFSLRPKDSGNACILHKHIISVQLGPTMSLNPEVTCKVDKLCVGPFWQRNKFREVVWFSQGSTPLARME